MLVEVIDGGGEEEEEGSEPSSEAEAVAIAEKLNDRRVQLAGFLKLVLFGSVDMKMAAPVFAHYVKVSTPVNSLSVSYVPLTLCVIIFLYVYTCIVEPKLKYMLYQPPQKADILYYICATSLVFYEIYHSTTTILETC